MKNSAQTTESKLFEILSDLDTFIATSIKDGETIADEIREELATSYEQMKNSYTIESL
jgi:hypothetical protein